MTLNFPCRLIPRSRITQVTTPRTLTRAPQLDWQVLRRNVLLQLGLVGFTEDMDFANGSFVQPGFDEGPDGGEEVRGVDDEHVTHCLGL